jgi:aminoglycoside phosphotransferase (APT) family kinase protein
MVSVTYSQRLGPISEAQLQAALDRFGLGRLVSAAPIPFGLFGQNVFVNSTHGAYILRGAPHYDWQLPAEQFFARLLHERTAAPTPWPYLLDPADAIFGWSYALMPRLPGRPLADPAVPEALTDDDLHGIARALGVTLAELQTLRWPHAGRYDHDTGTIAPFATSYGAWVIERIDQLLASIRTHSSQTTADDLVWIRQVLEQAASALAEPLEPRFVMEDYTPYNTTAEPTDAGWRISGVFDLMTAHFGDGEADLSRSTAIFLDRDPALAASFLRAYLEQTTPRPGFAARFPAYMLYDRLIIWEYLERAAPGWQEQPQTLRAWAEPYVGALAQPDLGRCIDRLRD